jgi:outer membrane immunogenic protein
MTPLKSALLVSTASALALSVLAVSTPAKAQAPYNWTGFYIGANAGYAWGRSDVVSSFPCTEPIGFGYICAPLALPSAVATVAGTGSGRASDNGFTGGGQVGYNLQAGNFVYGLEADFGAFHLKASRAAGAIYPFFGLATPFAPFTYNFGATVETDWLFTARGRVGAAFGALLIYGTGGLAVTELKLTTSFSDNFPPFPPGASAAGTSSKTKTGWTLGGGAEWALGNNWTVKGEFLYIDFGSVIAPSTIRHLPAYASALNTSADLTARVARLGINFRF